MNIDMKSRASLLSRILAALAFVSASPAASAAFNVTVTDTCGNSLAGSGVTTSVGSNGDVTLSGVTAPYAALLGCESPAPATPQCSLSASQTLVGTNVPVTLVAKCSNATSWSWASPPNTPVIPTGRSVTMQFPNPGAYTYSVSGNSGVFGPRSNQLTILVGDAGTPPVCTLTASPTSIFLNGTSRLQVVCNPTQSSHVWTGGGGGAALPASGDPGGLLTFTNPGTVVFQVQGVGPGGTGPLATAAVTVGSSLSASASLTPASIGTSAPSLFTVTISNQNGVAASGVAFTATYPANLVNASRAGGSTTCTNGTVTAANNGTSLALSGASLGAGASCTVTVNVTSAVVGTFSVSTGTVTSTNLGSGPGASAFVTVLNHPTITKAFSPASVAANATSTLTLTISNPNSGAALSGIAVTDSYPAGLVNGPASPITNCPSGTVTAVSGGSSLYLSGATISGIGTCTVSVGVQSPASGAYQNTIVAGTLTTANAGSNLSSPTAVLTVGCPAPGYEQGPIAFPPINGAVDHVLNGIQRITYSFSMTSGERQITLGPSSLGTSPSRAIFSVSTTPGDFSVTGACYGFLGTTLFVAPYTTDPSYCKINPGVTYYVNVRHVNDRCSTVSACTDPSGSCASRLSN